MSVQLLYFLVYRFNGRNGLLAAPEDYIPHHHIIISIVHDDARPRDISQGHLGDVFYQNGPASLIHNHTVLDIRETLDEPDPSHHTILIAQFNDSPPHVDVRLGKSIDHLREGNPIFYEIFRDHLHHISLYEPSVTGYILDALGCFDISTNRPVLERPQFHQIIGAVNYILHHLPHIAGDDVGSYAVR